MDRINYRRTLPVYLSDIWALEEKDPNIGQFSRDGHFSIQINHILGTAKGVYLAGEQENKKLTIKGGLVGTARRGNSMNKFFLASRLVSEIENEPREISHFQKTNKNSRCIESK